MELSIINLSSYSRRGHLDYHTKLQDAAALLGDEGALLWEKMIGNVNGASAVEGWFLPQYSYAPGMELAQ